MPDLDVESAVRALRAKQDARQGDFLKGEPESLNVDDRRNKTSILEDPWHQLFGSKQDRDLNWKLNNMNWGLNPAMRGIDAAKSSVESTSQPPFPSLDPYDHGFLINQLKSKITEPLPGDPLQRAEMYWDPNGLGWHNAPR